MRLAVVVLSLLLLAGCASPSWEVIPGPVPILLNRASGETWSDDVYLAPGKQSMTHYWKEMKRGQAATRPAAGV